MGWVECVVHLDRVLFLRDCHERPVSVRHNAGIARDSAPTSLHRVQAPGPWRHCGTLRNQLHPPKHPFEPTKARNPLRRETDENRFNGEFSKKHTV
jgi:hypothetical protein